jgi:hypothetical protein
VRLKPYQGKCNGEQSPGKTHAERRVCQWNVELLAVIMIQMSGCTCGSNLLKPHSDHYDYCYSRYPAPDWSDQYRHTSGRRPGFGAVAGLAASMLFAVGVLGASLLAGAVLPLTTAGAVDELFGMPKVVSLDFRRAPILYIPKYPI